MEQYIIAPSQGKTNQGDCYCNVCEIHILGTEDCVSIHEKNSGYITYVCSEQCATFFVFRGKL